MSGVDVFRTYAYPVNPVKPGVAWVAGIQTPSGHMHGRFSNETSANAWLTVELNRLLNGGQVLNTVPEHTLPALSVAISAQDEQKVTDAITLAAAMIARASGAAAGASQALSEIDPEISERLAHFTELLDMMNKSLGARVFPPARGIQPPVGAGSHSSPPLSDPAPTREGQS